MSYILNSINEDMNEYLRSAINLREATELTKTKTNEFLANLNSKKFGKVPYIIVNAVPSENTVTNTANIKDVDKLTDKDIPKIIAFIKGDGKLCAYGNDENAAILKDTFSLGDIKVSSGKFKKNADGVYEYMFRGKRGFEAEKHIDETKMEKILRGFAKLWKPIDTDLAALLASDKAKKITTETISPNFELYALGALNTKTKLSLEDIFSGKIDKDYKAWKIADTLAVDRTKKKFLSISNKLDKGVITIGGIPINEIRRCFAQYKNIDKMLGIDSDYIKLLKQLLVENKPIAVKQEFATQNAPYDETTLGQFLMNLCSSIYRFGYVITETSPDGTINNFYPVNNDYVNDIKITGCKFSVLSEKKKKKMKLPEAKKGYVWTLGFKIEFIMHGRKYTWDFRDHIGNGSLTVATIKRG